MTPITAAMRHRWWLALTLLLAGGYQVIGILSPAASIRWPFVIGAVLVTSGLLAVTRSKATAWTAVVVGALAPVVTTWWSVASPITALLILGCGTAAIRATRTPAPPHPPAPS